MKLTARFLTASAVLAAALIAGAAAAQATRHVTLTFTPDELQFSKAWNWDVVSLNGASWNLRLGEPQVPLKQLYVSLPIGYQAVGFRYQVRGETLIPGTYRVLPNAKPLPTSHTGPVPKPAEGPVYRSGGVYPNETVALLGTGNKSGYPIAEMAVYPVHYEPATGRLSLITAMDVEVSMAPSITVWEHPNVRSADAEAVIREDVMGMVANPDEVPATAAEWDTGGISAQSDTTAQYLIVTSATLKSLFQPLADWKKRKGVSTVVLDTTWIYANYAGEQLHDNADKIRQCIKDYWTNHGTIYVLLGGDVEVVPYRQAYAKAGDNGENLPADLYFSDLNGNWNADGDSYFGEYPSDSIDMVSDVYVGRAPVNTGAEVTRFVGKVLQYEGEVNQPTLPTDYELKVLMLGSKLDSTTDMGILENTIVSSDIPARFASTKLYESAGTLSRATALAAINQGYNFINHCGHGNDTVIQTGGDYVSDSDMYAVTNGIRISLMYSMGCYTADYPYSDCLAERFVNAPNGGGFYVGNSHYGWYSPGNPSADSGDFDRDYWYNWLSRNNYYGFGQNFAKHKDVNVAAAKSDQYMRYIHYELNLFGDPELPVWKNTPVQLAASYPVTLPLGSSSFTVHVTAGGSVVGTARVCLWKGTEVYLTGQTNASGDVTFTPAPSTTGTLLVTATKNDYLPAENTASVVLPVLVGTVTLEGLKGSPAGHIISIEFRAPGTTNVVATYNVLLDASSQYTVSNVLGGTYDLAVKHSNWLRQCLMSVAVAGTTTANFDLSNGDADFNNTINLLDLSTVLSNFGMAGPDGDLDWDGNVTLLDLSCVLSGFGFTGDN